MTTWTPDDGVGTGIVTVNSVSFVVNDPNVKVNDTGASVSVYTPDPDPLTKT